jgi:hypothetical protein
MGQDFFCKVRKFPTWFTGEDRTWTPLPDQRDAARSPDFEWRLSPILERLLNLNQRIVHRVQPREEQGPGDFT